MLVEFITDLIILSFAFRIILMLVGLPLHAVSVIVIVPVTRGRVDRASFWATLINPLVLASLYGGFIALVTLRYTSAPGVREPELYLACGAIAAFFSLVSYANGLISKVTNRFISREPGPDDKAYWIAASMSLVAGLAASVFFYLRPGLIMQVPGAEEFFSWAYRLAEWLHGFKAVQVILALGILGYILYFSVSVIIGVYKEILYWLKGSLARLWPF